MTTTLPAYTKEVANDAGLLREYLVQRYSREICYGGAPTTMARLRRQVRRLARLSRQRDWQTWNHLRGDVERAAGRV